jgi:hypothetical protein
MNSEIRMTRLSHNPGYARIQATSHLLTDSEAWEPFVRDILKMPISMLKGVQYAVRGKFWMRATDPLRQVRVTAERWTARHSSDHSPLLCKLAGGGVEQGRGRR